MNILTSTANIDGDCNSIGKGLNERVWVFIAGNRRRLAVDSF